SVETYLFTILRRKIINNYRSQHVDKTCLLHDIYHKAGREDESRDPFGRIASPEATASWYARRDEQHECQSQALSGALRKLVEAFKKQLNFRELQIVEMLFYCRLANKDVAKIMDMTEQNIGVIKHRCLKRVRESVSQTSFSSDLTGPDFETLLTDLWESLRLSCPKRSTIGAYLLETLEPPWHDYVHFHLETLGCHFCRANLSDLKDQTTQEETSRLRKRIMESTVGFLHK
ncbi:MAG: sigma-70 family RNA polymerase sigma factor, partial [Sedimentisphaerales bacterium]|nr:sigma-70 family RNA polymerase sigma factor [Sedimentisphaerales bacterium]